MGGTTSSTGLDTIGQRCLIEVGLSNSPQGWWWGILTGLPVHKGHGYVTVEAVITGRFRFQEGQPLTRQVAEYGTAEITPQVNYRVYAITPDVIDLVRDLLRVQQEGEARTAKLLAGNAELRQTLAVSPELVRRAVQDELDHRARAEKTLARQAAREQS